MSLANKVMRFAESLDPDDYQEYEEEEVSVGNAEIASSCRSQGMPQRIIDTITGDYFETEAMQTVKKFLEAPREGWCLVLSGPKGCGKSTAAAYYLWEKTKSLAVMPTTRRWWTGSRVGRVSGYANAHQDPLEDMMKLPVMVIDDLGVEYLDKNGFANELFDERWGNYRKTIITTNLNSKDFQQRYEQRVTDRIRHGFQSGGDFKHLTIKGKSLRAGNG